MVEFASGVKGITLNLDNENVEIILFSSDIAIKNGDLVKRSGSTMDVPVEKAMLGSLFSMPKLDNSCGYFEALRTQLPYELHAKTNGFYFIGTVYLIRRLTQNTYQDFITKRSAPLQKRKNGMSRRHRKDKEKEMGAMKRASKMR
ncbi:ATP synthase subunit alpha, mitochondrial [Capsicum baccatum]|uniref:ATP synthase subunit alpha, mitochondrial n=1 Tax=Capsicum baccatum TaxID=33114 RepID=A0A2G2XPK3_CAPBA|nr:ATP synthase subunit alpha, mitochondrial [Capsicum baccatum]